MFCSHCWLMKVVGSPAPQDPMAKHPWLRPWHVSPEECVQALNEIHAAQSREDLSAEAKLKQLVHELDPLALILFSRWFGWVLSLLNPGIAAFFDLFWNSSIWTWLDSSHSGRSWGILELACEFWAPGALGMDGSSAEPQPNWWFYWARWECGR